MSESTDEELMLKIQQGDQRACEALVDQHLMPLTRFAVRMLGSRSRAEDATQETFLKVWTNAHQWQSGKAKVSTWLHTIAHNVCIDHIRKDKSLYQESLSKDHNTDSQPDDEPHEMSDQIFSALNVLAESQRTAIVLCYYQGLSNKDAAHVIGVSVPALESLLARGRRALKKVLMPVEEAN